MLVVGRYAYPFTDVYSSFDRSHLAIDRILFMDKTYLEKESKSKLNIFVIRLGGEKSFISFII